MLMTDLSIKSACDMKLAADLLMDGEVLAIAFNGVYGLFGDADNEASYEKIYQIKNRPEDKQLILVSCPEYLHEFVDFSSLLLAGYPLGLFHEMFIELHAIGIVLPAAQGAPERLIKDGTILNIWTEYLPHQPIRRIIEFMRRRGGRAIVGTSANISGRATCSSAEEIHSTFCGLVRYSVIDDFAHLPPYRRVSTTIVDFAQSEPYIKRRGNVPPDEIEKVTDAYGVRVGTTLHGALQPIASQS